MCLAAVVLAASTLALTIALLSGGGTSDKASDPPIRVEALMRRAVAEIERGDVEAGRRRIAEVLRAEPDHPKALLYQGQFARERGDLGAALASWRRVPDDAGRVAATARYLEAALQLELRQAVAAERLLRRASELNPAYLAPHERLLTVYVAQMRADDIRAELAEIEKLRPLTLDELALELVAEDRILDVEQGVVVTRGFVETDPGDIPSRTALARYLSEDRPVEATAVLTDVLAAKPDHEQARAFLAGLHLDRGDVPAAERLFDGHQPTKDSPAIAWLVFGRLREAADDWAAAGDAYVEAVRRRPNDGRARYWLGQVLERLGRREEAVPQLDRAKLLDDLNAEAYRVSRGDRGRPDLLSPVLVNVANLLVRLGRMQEAELWYDHALKADPGNVAARQGYQAAREAVVVAYEESLPEVKPIVRSGSAAVAPKDAGSVEKPGGPIHLVDRAGQAKLDFAYWNGETGRKYLVESVGGGVAVLDYDGDAWPDLYFCQGSDLPHEPDNHEHADQLFRNLGDGTFEDVTDRAGLNEHGYSLGCSAADVDNDGDPDLYVTNHGRDTLFLNNGDGTFQDVSEEAGVAAERMSSSAAFADFDADGDLDLYVATYVDSLRICRMADGRFSTCDPHNHEGEPDLLYRNEGDGTFTDISHASGIAAAPDGKGLGVLVADLDEDGRLDVYVANDTTPNFLFFNRTEPGGPLLFEERGLSSGTALNGNGEAEAGMGIAAADFDGDGRIDLHVTNFYLESNTLYRNLGDGLFEDATRAAGLVAPTIPWLGFGTQAADFDLNGVPDLFVANGHIDNFESRGEPWKMPAQLFKNTGGGRFVEVSESVGPYFSERCLGRGAARLDWNRDGRPDLAVVHQDRPATLLTNETPDPGHFVHIRLHGVRSNRDGIGARLRITADGRTQTVEICGGDGIMCSNERVQIVGLGSADEIDRLEIAWPSGETTVASGLPKGAAVVSVEGRPVTAYEASPLPEGP